MKLKSRLHTLATAALLICSGPHLLAQEEFPEDVQDVPAAPIDNMIVIALILGYVLLFILSKKPSKSILKSINLDC